jgi:hypothetical protein
MGPELARQAAARHAITRLAALAGGSPLQLPFEVVDGESDGAVGRLGGLVTDDMRAQRAKLHPQVSLNLPPRLVPAQHQHRPRLGPVRQRVALQPPQMVMDALLDLAGQREALRLDSRLQWHRHALPGARPAQ